MAGWRDCLELVSDDLQDHNEYRGHCLQEITAQGGVSREGRSAPLSALRPRGMVSMTTMSADWAEILKAVALEVLGQPAERRGNEWRYGRHGSLVVNISGQRAGTWRDFEAGHAGGTLELLRHYQDLDKPQALECFAMALLLAVLACTGAAPTEPATEAGAALTETPDIAATVEAEVSTAIAALSTDTPAPDANDYSCFHGAAVAHANLPRLPRRPRPLLRPRQCLHLPQCRRPPPLRRHGQHERQRLSHLLSENGIPGRRFRNGGMSQTRMGSHVKRSVHDRQYEPAPSITTTSCLVG